MKNNIDKQEELLKKFKYLEKKNIEDKAELKIINGELKEKFDCNNSDEENKKLNKLKKEISSFNDRLDGLVKEIEDVTDWDKIEDKE